MEQDYSKEHWTEPCPKYDCRKTACKCGLKYVNIPSSLGDDSEGSSVAPKNGAYCNALVFYEANEHVYIYTQDGVPTLIDVDASDISTLEQEVIKAQKDVHELREDIDDFIYGFDTVAQMKAATNLSNGDRVRTLGYFAKNDGGGAFYKVTNIQPSGHYETLDGLLCAELILEDTMNLTQFGVDHNSEDAAPGINHALSVCAPKGVKLIIPSHTYNLKTLNNSQVSGYNYTYFIKAISGTNLVGEDKNKSILRVPNGDLSYTSVFLNYEIGVENIKLSNFTIEQYYESGEPIDNGDRSNRKLAFVLYGRSTDITIEDMVFDKCCGVNVVGFFSTSENTNVTNVRLCNNIFNYYRIRNIPFYDRSVVYMECSDYIVEKNTINGNFETLGGIELHGSNGICNKNLIKQCKFGIYTSPRHEDSVASNLHITDNILVDNACHMQMFPNTKPNNVLGARGVIISNNNMKSDGSVLVQEFFMENGMEKAVQVMGISIYQHATDKNFDDVHICNNSMVIKNYSQYKTETGAQSYSASGISLFGRSNVKNTFVTNNYIEGYPGAGIVIGDARSAIPSGGAYTDFYNVIISDNTIKNCGYLDGDISRKAFLSFGYGNYKNVIAKNNILDKTDGSYATTAAIYNLTNADCTKVNLYCINNILDSVLSGEFERRAYNEYDIIYDKGDSTRRPTIANAGDEYYDTTLNKMIMYNGTDWVNVDGTSL